MLKELEISDYNDIKIILPRLSNNQFINIVNGKNGYKIIYENKIVGLFLFKILWERFPFIEHLIIKKEYQNKLIGTNSILEFENLMKLDGYKIILLSTQVDQKAQFLYRKLGYKDCGSLFLENTPFDQPCELFFKKNLE